MKSLQDWKENLGMLWFWLGVAVFALNLFVVTPARWEFWYALVYSLGFIAVGLTLSYEEDEVSGLTALCAVLIGVLAVVMEAQAVASVTASIISVILFIFVLLDSTRKVKWTVPYAQYSTLAVFALWFIWPALYFYRRYIYASPINLETSLYHGGIMLLAFLDLVTFAGAALGREKPGWYTGLRVLFTIAAIIGAAALTIILGWGLTLVG